MFWLFGFRGGGRASESILTLLGLWCTLEFMDGPLLCNYKNLLLVFTSLLHVQLLRTWPITTGLGNRKCNFGMTVIVSPACWFISCAVYTSSSLCPPVPGSCVILPLSELSQVWNYDIWLPALPMWQPLVTSHYSPVGRPLCWLYLSRTWRHTPYSQFFRTRQPLHCSKTNNCELN